MRRRLVWLEAPSHGPAICISTALVLVLLLGGWGAYQDWEYIRLSVLRSEITRVRSHATRTASQLELQLTEFGGHRELTELVREKWLREHWSRSIPPPDRVYSAVVDPGGLILAHSEPKFEGTKICSDWNAKPVRDAGPDVYSTQCPNLTGGVLTLDVIVPIQTSGITHGTYHAGASQEWVDQLTAAAHRRSAVGWGIVIGGITIVVLLSSLSLYQITRRSELLAEALRKSQAEHLAELNYLVAGLSHEVRNLLNVVRLNIYTADRVFRGEATLESNELSTMLGESVREIESIDNLMTILLGYARADHAETVTVDIAREVQSVVQFMRPMFEARGVKVTIDDSNPNRFLASAGRGQVRQVLLNLLKNSVDAVADGTGEIVIKLDRTADMIDVTITDNGIGIPVENRERLFSPFFSTKDEGTGLGLALVRSLTERAGGHAECIRSDPGRCQFQVFWPAASNRAAQRQAS